MDNETLNTVETEEIVSPETMASEETQEVAEPAPETSEEKSEVAAPAISKQDAAFAQMRRENERLRREAAQLNDTLGLFFDGDDKVAQARAHYFGKDVNEVKSEMAEAQEVEMLRARVKELEGEQQKTQIESRMASDLATLQKLDPNIKSLSDVGEKYLSLIAAGVDCETAYDAQKAYDERHKVTTPKAIGSLNSEAVEKDYYSREEVEAMSPSEVHKNYEKIRASMSKWK